mmetsp:Transcript_9656/g.34485  ORF Transcript_9656/g.34485 Transcript_9656/m.34485 type:complete len:625 (+) Transcript_9656:105-1979(+)
MESIGEEDTDRSEGTLSTTRSLPDQVTPERSAKRRLRWPLEGSRGSTLKSKSNESTTSWLHSSKTRSKSSEQTLNTDLSMVRLSRKTGIKLFPGQLEEDSSQFENVVDLNRMKSVDPVKEGEGEAMMRAPSRSNTNVTNLGHMLSDQVFSCCVWRRGGSNQNTEGMTESEIQKMPPSRTRWWQVTLYIINDAVGSWLVYFSPILLGMWGWVLGILILILMWPLNLYTAHLLWRCRNAFPGAISIGDLVFYVTRSSVAMYAAFFFANLCILITLSNQVFTAASNIYYFFDRTYPELYGGMCFAGVSAIVVAILVPLTQIRYLHQLTLINIVNIACMLVFIAISVYVMATNGRAEGAVTGIDVELMDSEQNSSKYAPIIGVEMLFTAYYYQTIILEIMGEMKDPAEFPKANYWSTPVVLGVALIMSSVQYYFLGEEDEREDLSPQEKLNAIFSPETRGRPASSYVAIICFTIHMLGCCVIKSIVLTRSLQLLFNPESANRVGRVGWRARLEWAGISILVLSLGFVVTLYLNQFGLVSVVLGFLTLIVTILLPIGLYLACESKRNKLSRIPKLEMGLMALILVGAVTVIIVNCIRVGQTFSNMSPTEVENVTLTHSEIITECSGFEW